MCAGFAAGGYPTRPRAGALPPASGRARVGTALLLVHPVTIVYDFLVVKGTIQLY